MADHSFEDRKAKFSSRSDRMKLLFQWVKDDLLSYKQFEELLELDCKLKEQAVRDDTFD